MTVLVRAASLAGYESMATALGLDARAQLRRVGLSSAALADPDALIPYVALMHLLERSAAQAACPDFGLRLSQTQALDTLGTLSMLLRHASTLGEALTLAARYVFVHSPALGLNVVPVPQEAHLLDLCLTLDMPKRPPCAQTMELSLGLILQCLRLLAPQRVDMLRVSLPHAQVADLAAYQQVFGRDCDCVFDAPVATLRMAAADLDQALSERNPLLQTLARHHLELSHGDPELFFADHVRAVLRRKLGTVQASKAGIAQTMAIHPRTLQRRLEAEGQSFEAIVDALRQQRLRELLARPEALPLAQVAQMLGYRQQAALTRSCQRWFGCSPTALRRQLRG